MANKKAQKRDIGSRFGQLDEDDIADLERKKDKPNTKKQIQKSVRLFRKYCEETLQNKDFESLSKPDLDKTLRLFYANVRTETGDYYKKSSLESLKYGLTRYLRDECDIDMDSDEFKGQEDAFKAVKKDLVNRGKGDIEHKQPISRPDLVKLYTEYTKNHAFDPNTPVGLQQKVFFEILLYLCRRGRENLRDMNKETFAVTKDSQGREYVYQARSEEDKNHDSEKITFDSTRGEGRMYEVGSDMCPVKSFKKYVSLLQPDKNELWQTPKRSFLEDDSCWYTKTPLGESMLNSMMTRITKQAKLSMPYTNHCIRATTITMLDEAGVEARHIMRISGHK